MIRTLRPIARPKSKKTAPGRNEPRAKNRSKYPASFLMPNIVPQTVPVRRVDETLRPLGLRACRFD